MVIARASWWILCGLMIQGCMGSARPQPQNHGSSILGPAGKLDFGWKLSGDRAVAPLQVFSDATQTWLQWLPQQAMPLILASSHEGDQVLSYTRQDPYTIIAGHWSRLIFRIGHQQAQARRVQSGQPVAQNPSHSETKNPQQAASAKTISSSLSDTEIAVNANSGVSKAKELAQSAPPVPKEQSPATTVFTVTPDDRHLRQTLTRWAGISGWYFQPEHWSVEVDIPLAGGAKFSDDFVASVQALVGATELSDRPLQPCFYANQVLRIIAASEACDRSAGPAVTGAPT